MNYLIYDLDTEGFINRFITTGVYCKPQQFEKAILTGKTNEWLKKGFAIHENPCRKEFVKKRLEHVPEYKDLSCFAIGDKIEVFEENNRLKMYFPFGNTRVEASEFYFNPTYLRTYAYTYLYSKTSGIAEFELETCGGATIWLNDQLITDFTPFTRNTVKSTVIQMELKQGLNKLVVCLDDLAERDTDYYFRLRYTGSEHFRIYLPISDDVSAEEIYQVEDMLKDMNFDKEVYISELVELNLKNILKHDLKVHVDYKPVANKIAYSERLVQSKEIVLEKESKKFLLFDSEDVIPGFYFFQVRINVNGIEISRKIGMQIFDKKLLIRKDSTIKERKIKTLKYIQDIEVENVYKAAAIFKMDGDYKVAERILQDELIGISKRKDCSDFYLIIVIYIYKTFNDKLTDNMKKDIENVLINFRYWIDEPGNDVMWFFSENHALLFHSCQYLAGNLMRDAFFTNSGLTGKDLSEKGKRLLESWFQGFFNEFITEWNSNAYIPVDVLGLCSLYNMTEEDEQLHLYAKKALDHIFYDLALNSHKGTIMTTFGRSYEKELKGNYTAGTTVLLYIAYNTGYLNRDSLASVALALGNYEPPKEYQQYIICNEEKEVIYKKTQGFEQHVNLYMYKNKDVQLSTAIQFKPFEQGYQEHIVQATISPTAQVFINHPGEIHPYGNGRPNFWAGNGILPRAVQCRNISILQYEIPESHRINYTHAYIPLSEFQSYIGEDHCVVVEKDGGYIGVIAMNGLDMQKKGPCKYREFISRGRKNIWVVKVGSKTTYSSLTQFYDSMSQISIIVGEDGIVNVKDPENGCCMIDIKGNFKVNNKIPYKYPLTTRGIVEENK